MISPQDRYVILARYKGYQGDFEGALQTLDEGIERFPDYGPLYRHRGHRRITFKDLDGAIADFERAIELCGDWPDEIEYYRKEFMKDAELLFLGRPEEMNPQRPQVTPELVEKLRTTYKSTLHSSIWYHYALAFYLKGDYDRSYQEYTTALGKAVDDDMRVASSDWIYMSLRRSGRHEEAARFLATIPSNLEVHEQAYFRRLLMYKGELAPESLIEDATRDGTALVTQGYGLGNWHLYNGRTEEAIRIFEKITAVGVWNAFGHIAAEIDLANLKGRN